MVYVIYKLNVVVHTMVVGASDLLAGYVPTAKFEHIPMASSYAHSLL
ncbi:hypothetical protein ACR6HW_09310 [Fusibacter sp. JL298sf-3]